MKSDNFMQSGQVWILNITYWKWGNIITSIMYHFWQRTRKLFFSFKRKQRKIVVSIEVVITIRNKEGPTNPTLLFLCNLLQLTVSIIEYLIQFKHWNWYMRLLYFQVASLCQEAALCALNEDLDMPCVYFRHFEEALKAVLPRTTQQNIKFYENFSSEGFKVL